MTTTPIWFLDIDGVINSDEPRGSHIDRHGQFSHTVIADKYSFWWRPRVVDFINTLNRDGLAEVLWLTTWEGRARTEIAPALGLDDFPAITNREGGDEARDLDWWKWARVKETIGPSDRRFVWTDDLLTGKVPRYARSTYAGQCLLVTPMSAPGLDDGHLIRIRDFLLESAT